MQVYLSAWPGKSKLCLSSKLISGIIPGTKLIWKCLKHSTTGRCDAMIWEIFNIRSVNPIKLYGRTLTKEVYVNINSFVLSPDLLLTFAGVWAGVIVRGPLGFEPFPLLFPLIVDLLSPRQQLCKTVFHHSPFAILSLPFHLSVSAAVSISFTPSRSPISQLSTQQFNIHTCVSVVQLMLGLSVLVSVLPHSHCCRCCCCFGITNQVADYKWNPFLIEIYILGPTRTSAAH